MEILSELFQYILITSLCACAIILIVLLLRLMLKKAPKWIHVLLWGIVALSLIVVPIIANTSHRTDNHIEPPIPDVDSSVVSPAPSNPAPPQDPTNDINVQLANDINLWDRIIDSIKHIRDAIEGASAKQLKIPAILWIVGVVSMLTYTNVSYWRLRRKVATAVRLIDNIYQSENVGFPFVLGFFKPRIYLPFKINLPDLEHIIAHEQAHIRRKDHWWKPIGFTFLTIQWFNPLM